MRVFKSAWFQRFAHKQGITDKALLEAIKQAEQGLIDSDLGSNVIKQRVPRQGEGKSSGFRTIILYRPPNYAFFVYGFAKNDRSNINEGEQAEFRKMAHHLLGLSHDHLAELVDRRQFLEIQGHDEKLSQ